MLDQTTIDQGVFAGLRPRYYRAIVVDPPWQFRYYTDPNNLLSHRGPEKHYCVMGIEDITALPVGDLAHCDSHLFMWTTGPLLPLAFDIMKTWGFRYSSVAFVWIKLKRSINATQLRASPLAECDLHVGLGWTTRKNAELCLLGRRGNAKRISKSVREVILSPVREHSRKPDEMYRRVEQYCEGPYLDLFARESRPNWTSWGAEKDKFK